MILPLNNKHTRSITQFLSHYDGNEQAEGFEETLEVALGACILNGSSSGGEGIVAALISRPLRGTSNGI
jgi:hypothetical protein